MIYDVVSQEVPHGGPFEPWGMKSISPGNDLAGMK